MNKLNYISIKIFVDEVRNYGIDKNISKLSDKDKKFIILCTEAIKSSNEKLVLNKKVIDNTKFTELRNSIISKMVDEKKVSNLYKVYREIKNFFSLFFNKNVIEKVNESAIDKELIKFVDDLKKYRNEHPGERLDFESFLKNRNQNVNFTNVNFKLFDLLIKKVSKTGLPPYWGTEIFKNVDFKNIHFDKCDIGYLNFTGSTFENCTFKDCNLNNTVFANVELKNVTFTNSLIQDSLFDESIFNNVDFNSSDLEYSNFYSSKMENINFTSCKMTGANLFEVKLQEKNNNITDCDLLDCLLFDTKKDFNISGGVEHKITKPIVLLPWNIQQPGVMGTKNFRSLKKEHSIPIRFNYFPNNIDTIELDTQVKNQIKFVKENPKEKILSIPEAVLRMSKNNPNDNSEILKIISHSDKLGKWVNAIMLPGGSDIEPEFYGQTKWKRTKTDPDYRRSLFEFALLEQGREKGIPVMGICRGSQMGNVYYGGTLKQHVGGQLFAIQSYDVKPSKTQGIIRGIAKEGIESYSEHHQAVDKISPELEKVLVYKNKLKIKKKGRTVTTFEEIPKALEGKKGAPLILTQFHPEYFEESEYTQNKFADFLFSKQNRGLISTFIGSADQYRMKKLTAEKIKDVSTHTLKNVEPTDDTNIKPPIEVQKKTKSSKITQQQSSSFFKNIVRLIKKIFSRSTSKPVRQEEVDKNKLIEGNRKIESSQYAWHLNLALMRTALKNAKTPAVKRQIEFLINNYLDKSAPLRARATKRLVADFESNYQAHPYSNYLYHRTEFLDKMKFSEPFNKKLAFGDKSPLIITETDEFSHLFPLSFKVMDKNNEKEWSQTIADQLSAHFVENGNIDKGLKKPLAFGMLLDLTSHLEPFIKTNGSKSAENKFNSQYNDVKNKTNKTIDESIDILIKQNPSLSKQKTKLKEFIKKNLTPISRLKIDENMSGIKILPIFYKLDKNVLHKKYENFIEFIGHTGIAMGAVNMRRYAMNIFQNRKDIKYGVEGDNAAYYKNKTDFINTNSFKRLSIKFGSKILMEKLPHFAILGRSTMDLLKGLILKTDEQKWNSLNADPATRQIIQTSLFQISKHLATAELHINNFAQFAQAIELVHAEMASLLELTRPYKEEDFAKIYKKQLNDIIPRDLQDFVKAGVGKTAVNLFAGINAALMQQNPTITRCYSKGLYYEQALVMGNDYKIENMLNDEKVKSVDLYACQTNPNIEIDTQLHNYEHIDIASDIKNILLKKPDTEHMTVAVDTTIDFLKSPKIHELLDQFKNEIASGKLNFVFFHSGQKFDMLGMDNYFGAPFYMVNNGSTHWEPFNALLNNKLHKTDPLSEQWFSLSNEFATDTMEDYRKQIFDNTKEIMKNIPDRLVPNEKTSQKVRVSTFDKEIEPCFIDIKVTGWFHKYRTSKMIKHFYKVCQKNGIKAFRRPSFGFYHPNITLIAGENDSTSIRINPGLNPKENAAIIEYLNDISKW